MHLNLITNAWIPVVRYGKSDRICPHEIAGEGVERFDWPRDDLNLGCLEFLIGLIFLADPPSDDRDWHHRYNNPDPDRLWTAFNRYSPYFELGGDGPRFLQDLDAFERQATTQDIDLPDMLFLDSAGVTTAKKNSDLMVKRNRYKHLDLPLAAMALYTLQAYAPSGGAGNRTSMRGGGPIVTLLKPLDGGTCPLWKFVWLNVPKGEPVRTDVAGQALPWLLPTRTSNSEHEVVTPDMSHPAEAFFGMPRRIRLRFEGDAVTGVVQRPHGTNYKNWRHPLSPYYSKEAGGQPLPVLSKPGRCSYQNWLGLVFGKDSEKRSRARVVREVQSLLDAPSAEIYAGGWAMSNMKPLDFSLHAYPTFNLDDDMDLRVGQLVEAANSVVKILAHSLKKSVSMKGKAMDAAQEIFFTDTEHKFVRAVHDIVDGKGVGVEKEWINTLRQTALKIFDQYTLSTLSDRNISGIEAAVVARRKLLACFTKQSGIHKKFPNLSVAE